MEILKLAKNEIKNLTNREIRYIIVTGGLSELAGFQYLVENVFGIKAKVCNISVIGLRNNKYSMISENDMNSLVSTGQKVAINDNIVSRVFGHFFDN